MSSTLSKTKAVVLKGIRSLSPTDFEVYSEDFLINEDKIRDRTCSITHRSLSVSRGSMSHQSAQEMQTVTHITPTVFIYNKDTFEERQYPSIEDMPAIKSNECLWIDAIGVHDTTLLTSISRRFKIHPLVILDIETHEQRTKLDIFDDALFLVLKLIYPDRLTQQTCIEQISFYLKENVLITFQEKPKDTFDQIKNKIRKNLGRIRKSKIDYLFYSLIDKIVDQYMDVLDIVNIKIEEIDHQLMNKLSRDTLETIYDLKRHMLDYRRLISPLKEIINRLQKEEETQIIQESTIIYLKDLSDHVVQVNDTIDTYRETLSSFIDFYMMINSNAMNEVVKTLTIISTIFIPLTFIAGVYGMNFDNMPEIHWEYGYYVVLSGMVALALTMLLFFKRKNWF